MIHIEGHSINSFKKEIIVIAISALGRSKSPILPPTSVEWSHWNFVDIFCTIKLASLRYRAAVFWISIPTLNFDRTYLCIGTRYQQSETNLSIYRDSPTCPKFGELWSRNGWERLASLVFSTFSRFDTIPACDRRTNRRTERHAITKNTALA